jgi:hypothetical protein
MGIPLFDARACFGAAPLDRTNSGDFCFILSQLAEFAGILMRYPYADRCTGGIAV